MKIGIVGADLRGCSFAYLMKRADASHQVRLCERDRRTAPTDGSGVFRRGADFRPRYCTGAVAAMTRGQKVHHDMAVVHRGTPVRANNVFHRIARNRPAQDLASLLLGHRSRAVPSSNASRISTSLRAVI